ncbi:cupin domain-containing protein [Corallococcus sp. bb12-1]|uniref:cupin domain-containing protein n=1 Tax=Corallococcus sp. bb12-1 TaxID=2996784 RepID=UPI00226EC665|nr:cupin domain-containing protein [Corallococcus sp. bb12-1]MCY1044205.1 cupin domain-containing protein [Corallococcus sp. bb12-1]
MSGKTMMDVLVHTADVEWKPLGPGTSYRLLRVSSETGVWSAILKMEKGAVFAPHRHLAPAEIFILSGATQDRHGTTRPGDYEFEPLGAEHPATTALEESIIHFTAHGPIAFYNDKGGIEMLLDSEFFLNAQAQEPQYSIKKAA